MTQSEKRREDGSPFLHVEDFRRTLPDLQSEAETTTRPVLVALRSGEVDIFIELCDAASITVHDPIHAQLVELAATRHPSADASERERLAAAIAKQDGGAGACGCWVYFPWTQTVVHLLGPEAYLEVATSRNRDKITREEQRHLREKRVGVVGLSVGGEAAVTLAQEHLCGELILADFDRLDLSNLNRLGASVADLGRQKTTIIARRIADVDPYLTVRVIEEGITEANMEAFMDGLDLLVEECDDLQVKHAIRRHARKQEVNVAYAADERGFVSVEPYGLRPGYPLFHGRVEEGASPPETFATPLEQMKALAEWLGGWDELSGRTQASLEALDDRLCGFPQLASEARYAAGLVGNVARRLLLGDDVTPMARHLDLTDLIPSSSDTST